MAATQDNRQLYFTSPLGKDYLLIKGFQIAEELSTLYNLELHLLHEETGSGHNPTLVEPEKIIGKSVTLRL